MIESVRIIFEYVSYFVNSSTLPQTFTFVGRSTSALNLFALRSPERRGSPAQKEMRINAIYNRHTRQTGRLGKRPTAFHFFRNSSIFQGFPGYMELS